MPQLKKLNVIFPSSKLSVSLHYYFSIVLINIYTFSEDFKQSKDLLLYLCIKECQNIKHMAQSYLFGHMPT